MTLERLGTKRAGIFNLAKIATKYTVWKVKHFSITTVKLSTRQFIMAVNQPKVISRKIGIKSFRTVKYLVI